MAFAWDDLQERIWLRWGNLAGTRMQSKHRVGGAALILDLVYQGPPPIDFLDILPAGLVAVENKAPGDTLTLEHFLRFAGKLALLLEREWSEEGRAPQWEATAGLLVASRVAKAIVEDAALAPEEREPGLWVVRKWMPCIYLVAADLLEANVRNAPMVLYYGSDRAVETLIREVPPEGYLRELSHLLLLRRKVVRFALEKRGFPMSNVEVDLRGAIEEIGLARVVEAVGLDRVIAGIGLDRLLAEVGLDRVIEEVRLDRVIAEVGLDRVIEEVGLDRVIAEVGLDRVIAEVGLDRLLAEVVRQAGRAKVEQELQRQTDGLASADDS